MKGVTATDLVLRITEILREHGVVGKFVEYYGSGLRHLSLPDRAIVAHMAPEYGATMGFFPVDEVTMAFFVNTNRDHYANLAKKVYEEQYLFRHNPGEEPQYSAIIELDMSKLDSTLAGPKRPSKIVLQCVI